MADATAGYPHAVDVAAVWRTYGRHVGMVLRAGPAPFTTATPGSFLACSGAPHVDVNQAALFGPATSADAAAIVEVAGARGVPVLLALSATLADPDPIRHIVAAGGFSRSPEIETLFHAPQAPPLVPPPFTTRRVAQAADHAAVLRVFELAHGYTDEATRAMYGPVLLDGPDVEAWLAWDGDEPISLVFVTRTDGTLGVFDMITAPAHRRRGAGRTVLSAALAGAAAHLDHSPSIQFWASPLGRPMYESMGFTAIDAVEVWTLGASAEDLAAVGAG